MEVPSEPEDRTVDPGEPFLEILAHEMRNRLAPIRTAVFLLKTKAAQDPELEKLRTIIDRQAMALGRLVDCLQDPLRMDPALSARAGLSVSPGNSPRPKRVLIIDDDQNDLLLHEILLEKLGYAVTLAATGEAGLAQAVAEPPEIALVDYNLPGMDGPEVATRIRAALGSAVFLVALSGHSHDEAMAQARAAGFDAFLVKGADPSRLVELLRERG